MDPLQDRTAPLRIAINGDLGSGKTTHARLLATRLGCEYYSTGRVQREIADRLGITTLKLNKRAESDPSIDAIIDSVFANLENEHARIVVDSRMAWYFLRTAVRLRLLCHPLTGAKRIIADADRVAEGYHNLETALADIWARRLSEQKRFFHSYNVDVEKLLNYDLVVQTDDSDPNEINYEITRKLPRSRLDKPELILSPRLVFPLDHVRTLARSFSEAQDANTPIDVLYWNDCFFVVDGHHRLSAALNRKQKWIVARLMDRAQLPGGLTTMSYLDNEFEQSRVYDWEAAHNFQFPFYPSIRRPGEHRESS